ncbi:MAG: holo-ACP synthase [Rhodospirillales bacterium]|nr:holo-ACP synthase [Rhodospirillales bacterium]
MILGLGTDLCDIQRIERSLARFGERFTVRVYTDLERRKAARRPRPASVFAQCFAAKEACTKALGTGLRRGVFLRDIEVGNENSGKPFLRLTGGALRRLQEITPRGMSAQIDVSLTDEYPLAHAIVIISAVAGDAP